MSDSDLLTLTIFTPTIFAILLIGLVGMLLDQCFARLQKAVTYVE